MSEPRWVCSRCRIPDPECTIPELLAASKAILEMYGPPSEYGEPARQAWERLEAAITEAIGEQP
jgi:hypothetical protein